MSGQTYRVVGSRTIRVASGEHEPQARGVALTEDEAKRLLAMGAVALDEPANEESAGAAADDTTQER